MRLYGPASGQATAKAVAASRYSSSICHESPSRVEKGRSSYRRLLLLLLAIRDVPAVAATCSSPRVALSLPVLSSATSGLIAR